MFRTYIIAVVFLFIFGTVCAASPDSIQISERAKTPLVKILPGVTAIAGVTFLLDKPVNNLARSNQTSFLNSFSDITDIGGEKTIVVPAILVAYLTGRFVLKDEKLQTTSLQSIQAIVVTAIATESLKHIIGRARPFAEEGSWSFQPFPGEADQYKSMPSGHVSLAFAVFTPFAENYSRWLYVVPAAVAFGRIYQDKHWVSDAAIGGTLGFVSGYIFANGKNVQIIPNGLRVFF
jgi:membrane-associated phospholipid phosphatase